ncbi:MAG TPA: DNA mismatch repair protein MutS, partial [Chlamydiales bacterium]|nr:DNA mismatch repair protein MutS [Chlamydiales bacterium]
MSTFLEATPMMQQWHQLKAKAKDALLLFRLGDFYEAFYDDAIVISKEIHLTLTKRQDIPMCGVPEHALDAYLDKLIGKGFKIAIAEQMEDPKLVKGLVKREIVRFVSPGTLIQSSLLSDKTNNYIVALSQIGKIWGGCSLDLSTSEMAVFEVETKDELLDEIFRLKPKEILVSEKCREQHQHLFQDLSHSLAFILDIEKNHRFDPAKAEEFLISHFQVKTLDIRDKIAAVSAAGALLYYLKEEMQIDIASIRQLKVENLQSYMALDRATLHHLDIVPLPQQKKWNLAELLDKTETAMGGRLLLHWVKHPLLCLSSISKRQHAIQELIQKPELLLKLKGHLSLIRDIERILVKV